MSFPTLYTGYACNTSGLKFSPGHARGERKINHRSLRREGDTGFEREREREGMKKKEKSEIRD